MKQTGPTLFDHAEASAERPPLLMLLDGHAMAFRAYFALRQARPLTLRSTGEDIRAVYAFAQAFLKALQDVKPTHVAIAFDAPGPTFRHEEYEAYKANRLEAPADFPAQLDWIKKLMTAFRVPIIEVPGIEADDAIGTIAMRMAERGVEVVICTGDTDTLQLVRPGVRVVLTTGFADQKTYDETAVREKYGGLEPHQQVDMKALKGDASDNIPGVPGIGEKTATKLILDFHTVEELYQNLDKVAPPRVQQLLREHEKEAIDSKRWVTIVTDASVEFDLEAARFGRFSRDEVLEVLRELEFNSLVSRVPTPLNGDGAMSATAEVVSSDKPRATEVTVVDTPAALAAMVAALRASEEFALDTETTSTRPMEAALVGLSFSCEPCKAYYVPVGHKEGRQLPVDVVMDAVRSLIEDDRYGKIGHNMNFDLTVLSNRGVRPRKVRVAFDTMIAAHLLGEKALGLKALAFNRLNVEMTAIAELIGAGRKQITFDAVPIDKAAPYAAADADVTLRLRRLFDEELKRDGLIDVMMKCEMPLVPVIVQCQVNGIALDASVLEVLDRELTEQIQRVEQDAYEAVGHRFGINSPQQLGDLLFKELKLPHGKRTQTGYSTDAATLEGLLKAPPEVLGDAKPEGLKVLELLLEYRALTKLKSTYVDTLPKEVNPRTGRIHTTYNQAGSATGRIASNDPNLQNIPIRTELGRRVRKAFVAEKRPDWSLLAADYSQVELRVLAHLSQDPALIAAFERDEDIHASTASLVYKVPMEQVTSDMRRLAKVMNFGVIYGLSAFGIAQQTELSVEEGSKFIETYFGTYPRVKEYLDETLKKARRSGYVETLLGRRRWLPELGGSNYQARQAAERMAVNMPVQGTAAEIIKVAMVQIQERMERDAMQSKMLLQVHDELVFETPKEEMEPLTAVLQEIMPRSLELVVPLKIDLKSGFTWGDME